MIIPPNHENTESWDHLILAGMYSPGVVTLSGPERVIGWAEQAANGQAGATSSRTGEPLGKLQASFYLVDEEYITAGDTDFTEWELFQQLCESSTSGKSPIALEVYHPDLARNHYTAIVLDKMGEMKPDGKGGATIIVSFREHRPKAPKPSGSATQAEANAAKQVDAASRAAADAAEKELADLIAKGRKVF